MGVPGEIRTVTVLRGFRSFCSASLSRGVSSEPLSIAEDVTHQHDEKHPQERLKHPRGLYEDPVEGSDGGLVVKVVTL